MRRVRPLTGNVLIELESPEQFTPSGIEIPNRTLSADEQQQRDHNPSAPSAVFGKVVEIGPWPKLPNGMCLLPEFGKGARVAVRPTSGITMRWDITGRLKMVSMLDVLAVLS